MAGRALHRDHRASTPNTPIPRTPIHGRRYANAPISNPSSPITINMPARNAVLSFVPNWSTAKFFSQIGVRSMNSAPTTSAAIAVAEEPRDQVADAERERGRDETRDRRERLGGPGLRAGASSDGGRGHVLLFRASLSLDASDEASGTRRRTHPGAAAPPQMRRFRRSSAESSSGHPAVEVVDVAVDLGRSQKVNPSLPITPCEGSLVGSIIARSSPWRLRCVFEHRVPRFGREPRPRASGTSRYPNSSRRAPSSRTRPRPSSRRSFLSPARSPAASRTAPPSRSGASRRTARARTESCTPPENTMNSGEQNSSKKRARSPSCGDRTSNRSVSIGGELPFVTPPVV